MGTAQTETFQTKQQLENHLAETSQTPNLEIEIIVATQEQQLGITDLTQKEVTSVEIETLKAQAEVEPVKALAAQLAALNSAGPDTLAAYLRNVRLALFDKAQQVYLEVSK